MAMVCCERHGAPRGVTHTYGASVRPVGYPNPAVICCRGNCHNPGLVWLNEVDQDNYNNNHEREIIIWGMSVKIRVV